MADSNREIDRIDSGGEAWEDTDVGADIVVNRPRDTAVPVRLPLVVWQELYREARELGIGPGALVRTWVAGTLHNRAHVRGIRA